MSFVESILRAARPSGIRSVALPRRTRYHPSPGDWRDEVLYFLLVDRFSDNQEDQRPLLDRSRLADARPGQWRWEDWARSGGERWQGGTLKGVASKLDYLQNLGVTTLWLSPVFKQRGHLDTYHGYGIQDFLEVDPRFGSRAELVELIQQAHARNMRIILDIIFNHSGENWIYPEGVPGSVYQPHYTEGRYGFGHWRGIEGESIEAIQGSEDGVWPTELQDPDKYTRAGCGNLGGDDVELENPHAEHKRTDFLTLKDFFLDDPELLSQLATCYKYWIALTDCDGFRIDTLKHVSFEQARNFCGSIKEFAQNLGKADFFLVGEIAGGDYSEDRYLDVIGRNLNAALDIGEMRLNLRQVAKGLQDPHSFFAGFDPGKSVMGSHRALGAKHVSVLDDHDHVFGEKLRFSTQAASAHQVVAGVGLQLFTLGIPCIYYGTEQSLGGPEATERNWLPKFGDNDRYLRETLFGAPHPLKHGRAGLSEARARLDSELPGFGPFGTAGSHCFDTASPAYRRIRHLAAIRAGFPALRYGRQYLRPVSFLGKPFEVYANGEIIAWSRILDDEEIVVVLNPHGVEPRGARILVDAMLNPAGGKLCVIASSEEAGSAACLGENKVGQTREVLLDGNGVRYIEINQLGPSEILVLANHVNG
ncbi:alpha-amylase family glycosyl hydrolase [Candidatus Thiothrix sp. Deng01]|uniref:Alpha-amylase family glycosyl hydrolase n=1 Tax=Candidatus Thiothrix phosphatis TaxID=3112415 RepID=A0ABU6CRY4_9GAMM|nr:alpha-amylase family glycosyl hydrolase [Candidatus Thiothrix sp. Deng01]MEB4589602.1 alpha-amylase family glycosyl hydrolase [Candidatus Thiothrix sp. Deng01]